MENNKKVIKVKTGVRKLGVKSRRKKTPADDKPNSPATVDLSARKTESPKDQKIERDKKLMMWAGVSFFMVLFLAIWIINVKSVFRETPGGDKSDSQLEWDKISDDFGQAMDNIKKGLDEFKKIEMPIETASTTPDSTATITNESTNLEMGAEEENIVELRDKLMEIEKNLKISD